MPIQHLAGGQCRWAVVACVHEPFHVLHTCMPLKLLGGMLCNGMHTRPCSSCTPQRWVL
jgi:hypothetical protein